MALHISNRIILCKNSINKIGGRYGMGRKLKLISITFLLLIGLVGCSTKEDVLESNITNKGEFIESDTTMKDKSVESNITSKDESLEKDNKPENENSTETESQEVKSNDDVLLNEEETKLKKILEGFSEAYFRGDKKGMSSYLTDGVDIEDYNYMMNKTDIYDTTEIKEFTGDISDIKDVNEIAVQYPFILEGEDSITYLGLEFIKMSGEWKVSNFYLEK